MVKTFIENPVVIKVSSNHWLAVYDSDAPNAIGYSVSEDGIHWTPEQVLVVQSEKARRAGDDGLWEVRTPLGLLPYEDGTYILLYTAKIKSVIPHYWAVGKCVVRLEMPDK